MKVASALLLSFAIAAATPPPDEEVFYDGMAVVHAEIAKGPIDIAVAVDEGWCYVRPTGSPTWLGPIDMAFLANLPLPGDQVEATAGATLCVGAIVSLHGAHMLVTKKIVVLVKMPSLDQAAAKAAQQLAAAVPPGASVVPCP